MAAFFAGGVHDDAAAVHHDGAVAQIQGGLHVVGDHQAGQAVFPSTIFFVRSRTFSAVAGSRAAVCFVEKQGASGRSASPSASAPGAGRRRKSDVLAHPVLQAHAQQGDLVAEAGPDRRGRRG